MIHYIYKIVFLCGTPNNRYYIGKRSTDKYDNWDDDPYSGSGVFCKEYFDKYGKIKNVTYKKICLEETESLIENSEREAYWIGDLWELDPLCMNKMPGGSLQDINEKPIIQYNIDGLVVGEFKSAAEASRETKVNYSCISDSCRCKRLLAGGFIWRFKDSPLNETELKDIQETLNKIDQYDLKGNYIRSFRSIKEASKITGINKTAICEVVNNTNPKRHTAGNYIWCKFGESPKNLKTIVSYRGKCKVAKYNKQGEFIESFNSFASAAKSVNGKFQTIQACCNNKCKTAYGFIWKRL